MSDDIGRECAALEPELIETRRALHRHPELGFAEHETAALVIERLRALGYEPRTGVGRTGVIADLEGAGPGPTLLIRADMDALALDASCRPTRHVAGATSHTRRPVGALPQDGFRAPT